MVTGGKSFIGYRYSPRTRGDLEPARRALLVESARRLPRPSGENSNRFKAVLCRVKPRSRSGCLISKVLPNLEFADPAWTIPRVHRRIVTPVTSHESLASPIAGSVPSGNR